MRKKREWLIDLRKSSNLSQKEIAYYLGFNSGQYISNIERGLCPLPLKKLKKYVKIVSKHAPIPHEAVVTTFIKSMVREYESDVSRSAS